MPRHLPHKQIAAKIVILALVQIPRDNEREKEFSFEALKVRVQLSAYKQRVLQYYLLLALNGCYAFSFSLSLSLYLSHKNITVPFRQCA